MQEIILENIVNKELFLSTDKPVSKIVDGEKFIKVVKISTQKEVYIRESTLRKVQRKTNK